MAKLTVYGTKVTRSSNKAEPIGVCGSGGGGTGSSLLYAMEGKKV